MNLGPANRGALSVKLAGARGRASPFAGLLYLVRSNRLGSSLRPRRFPHRSIHQVLPDTRSLGQGGAWTASYVAAALDQQTSRSPSWCQPSACDHEARNVPKQSPSANPAYAMPHPSLLPPSETFKSPSETRIQRWEALFRHCLPPVATALRRERPTRAAKPPRVAGSV